MTAVFVYSRMLYIMEHIASETSYASPCLQVDHYHYYYLIPLSKKEYRLGVSRIQRSGSGTIEYTLIDRGSEARITTLTLKHSVFTLKIRVKFPIQVKNTGWTSLTKYVLSLATAV